MSLSRPTLATLIDRVQNDIEGNLPGADARLRRTPERAFALALGGASHGMHGHIAFLGDQIIPDRATDDFMKRWAAFWGVFPKTPTKAAGIVQVSGVPLSPVPLGTIWDRADGVQFISTSAGTIGVSPATALIPVEAVEPGIDGNTDAATELELSAPVAGIFGPAVVQDPGIYNGTDVETNASLLARLLLRVQTMPTGGGPGDYVYWAMTQATTTRAWEYPRGLGAGTVLVRFMTDDATADGIPSAGAVTSMQTLLESYAPIDTVVTALAPIASPMNPSISITPDTAAIRAAVEAELLDLLRRRSSPGGSILLSQIDESISRAAGEEDHTLVSPTADIVEATGYITTLGTISWV